MLCYHPAVPPWRSAHLSVLACAGAQYDAVVASEVIEHVADAAAFMRALGALARPGGMVAVSTLARTPRAYALAIIGAEYVINLLPRGTHDWSRFINPGTLRHSFLFSEKRKEQPRVGGMLLVAFLPPLYSSVDLSMFLVLLVPDA